MSPNSNVDRAPLSIEVANTDLNFRDITVSDPILTGRQILSYCDVTPREEHVVLQWLPNGEIEEVRGEETIDVRGSSAARFIVARTDRLFRLVLNERSISWPEGKIQEEKLRKLGQIAEGLRIFVKREDEADEEIELGKALKLSEIGVEEVYSKSETWKLNVQGVHVISESPTIVVRAALIQAGFNPEQGWIIVLKTESAKKQVGLDDVIDLRAPGIEKLRLTPREINNGEAGGPRRQFRLLEADEKGLVDRDFRWETVVEGGRRWLILHDVELPRGYAVGATTIAIDVPNAYPAAELDMFYCYPWLERTDGQTIPQTQSRETLSGQSFQRWSRHRGAIAPWRVGLDNVLTHLTLVEAAILREVEA